LKSFFTGRKFFYFALLVISILFTTVYKNQHTRVSTAIKTAAAVSLQALPSSHNLTCEAQVRLESVSKDRINSARVVLPITNPAATPGTLAVATQTTTLDADLPSLQSFVADVANDEADTLAGIYVKGIMALRIVQQPGGDPAYIDRAEGTATQFHKASLFGTIGLLAHNDLSGRYFYAITPGTDLVLVYGNGRTSRYTVSEIGDYQRLSLADLRSDFMDLTTNEKKSADEVFAHYYQQKQTLTLQTCIAQNGVLDWGVRFIMARPYQPHPGRFEIALRNNP
jgi:hypothetical protein